VTQHQLGPCLDQPVAVGHMLQVLEQLAEVKSRFGQWATVLRDTPRSCGPYWLVLERVNCRPTRARTTSPHGDALVDHHCPVSPHFQRP
jgi:hypothetical protein